jgi:site-specific recombinase XerC
VKGLREAANRSLADHLKDFLADLQARQRGKHYLQHTRNRLKGLFSECGWNRLTEITADAFLHWRTEQTISPDTLNHYLGHANAFLNWTVRNGRLTANPLRTVGKVETRGHERCVRRALTIPVCGVAKSRSWFGTICT